MAGPLKGKKLLARVRARYQVMYEADQENRKKALEDLRFVNVPGEQWDPNMRQERGERPCLEFNKLRVNGKRVINEIRANRPQGKVRAVENGDKEIAEIYEGLCRNISNISDFDTIVDHAAEYQVDAGMGAWRIETRYSADDSFDQDICIKGIKNPFCLYADPACEDHLKRDAEDWILTDKLSNAAFEKKYGKAAKSDFEELGGFDDEDDWNDGEFVRIAEYWYKEPHTKEIWQVQGPEGFLTVDSESDEARGIPPEAIVNRRTVRTHKIMMCIVSGQKILEGPVEWPGRDFPFVMIYGETKVIEGKFCWWGLHRFAKDAQKTYNVDRTAAVEAVAGAPKEYFWATPKQAEGHLKHWQDAHRRNYPFKLYNADSAVPGPPVRIPGADVPVALLQLLVADSQDIRDVTGLHEASFGEESSEKSGIALARKQAQGQIVTYNFPDNMSKGICRTWEILVDLIPNVYDAEREVRIIGQDETEDYKRVNQLVFDPATGKTVRVNDLSTGKYDVAITSGPSYATLRQEATEVYGQVLAQSPEMTQLIGDLFFKSLDYPYADEIAERMQTMLPPQIQQRMLEGKDIPPEAQAVMAQAEQMMAAVQQHGQLVEQAAQEVKDEQTGLEKVKADIRVASADLRRQQADFKATVAEKMADLRILEAELDAKAQELGEDSEQFSQMKQAIQESMQTIQAMDQMIATYMDAEVQRVNAMDEEIKRPKPKLKSARLKRENGQMFSEMEFDDGSIRKLLAQRRNGQLEAVPVE